MKIIGNINKKLINEKYYFYHQYRENGKMITKHISPEEAYKLAFEINISKRFDVEDFYNHRFNTDVTYGEQLYEQGKQYSRFKKRYCYSQIEDYLCDVKPGKVLILYGLRRTGKTTLTFQTIANMSFKDHAKTAYIKLKEGQKYEDLRDDLYFLSSHGFKYFFIDEVTLLENFIAISSVFSDIFGTMGKVVLSGTDSLGLYIAKYDELFDRAIFVHTTYISFKEFSEVLGIDSIDDYIEYGGTMALDTETYNNPLTESNYTNYVDISICRNITHSLANYNHGDHFGHMYELYEKGELENVINRIIEDQNHRFAINIIEKDFKSNDLGSLKSLLAKMPMKNVSTSLSNIDEEYIITTLMNALNIINKERQSVSITKEVLLEVEEYLNIIDFIKTIDVIDVAHQIKEKKKVVIQPAIRYVQAKQLLDLLMEDKTVSMLPLFIKDIIREKLLNDVKGKMMEEIILYQTYLKNKDTFKVLFPVGEFDMVTLNKESKTSSIYEIKHSTQVTPKQYSHLLDEEKVEYINYYYYPVVSRAILYNGKEKDINGICYINVSSYLKSL